MTKRILVACLSAALLLVSCTEREFDTPVADENVLTVSLDPGAMGLTRATAYGEDKFNENEIKNFKLYFYTKESSDDAEAVYIYPLSGFATAQANDAANVGADFGVDPTTGKVTVRMKLVQEYIDRIFPSESSCRVYAVANLDGVAELPTSTSVNSLKKAVLTSNFGPDDTVAEAPYAKAQDSFAMDGEGSLTYNPSTRTVSGSVPMYRAASKITLTVTKVTTDGVEDKDWEPQTSEMRVAYINGINRSYLNGQMEKQLREGDSKGYLFSYKTSTSNKSRLLSGDSSGWTHELPFYSYYNLWRYPDKASDADCGDAPFLLLSVPWRHGVNGRYMTCYYAVPFNTLDGRLDRNTWYKINLAVSVLGSGDPDNPTELTPSYMILPWGNEVETNANLMRYRYLMVDQNYYEMHNINSLAIPFLSSHDVEVASKSLTYTRLKPKSGKYKPDENVSVNTEYYSVEINKDNDSLVFAHNLVNDYNKDYDVSAYTLTVTIRHTDDQNFYETLTIVQYPALYVRAELNSACTRNPDDGTRYNSTNRGYVYINNLQSNGNRVDSWQQVSDYSNAGNLDPYMYVVKVSSLPANSKYTIGDPRFDSYSVYNTSWTETANWLYGTNKQLSYYYPADEDENRVNSMIAPSFRIASSYGVVNTISYDDAKKRCAGYQEDGYPAGRWRIPTKAEIEYMVMLANDGKIPVLLSTDSYYWGSDKKGYRPNGMATTRNSFVRCVYDEWYWTDKCTKNTFTWGDKQR